MKIPPSTSQRPRVVMLDYGPDHPGGVTRVVESWLNAGLGDRAELTVIHVSNWDDSRPRQFLQAVAALGRLFGALARRPPDLVHMPLSVGLSPYRKLAASLICRAFRVPYLLHVHSGDFESWIEASRPAGATIRMLVRHAAATIVIAERWRNLFESLGAPRVLVVPNGLGESERVALESVRDARRRRPRLSPTAPAHRPTLLYYGRWSPEKGVDRIADALRTLDQAGRDYELRIFGSGDRGWLERCFEGLGGQVHIGGWIGIETKVAELTRTDALLVPSRVEGFGQVLLDARAAGVPMIASDSGAVSEVLAGHEPVRLSPAGDDDALRQDIDRVLTGAWPPAGIESAPLPQRFRAEAIVDQLLALYSELAPAR